ncbi:hypothetical protein GCM10022240_29370 [Microbacterium kribbense]|uniref:Uncharacterized protein n=1 Tax=Microbacterium kribbense TaxID=433645 RepID=A0ABP7H1P6_9MICO
MRPRRPGTIVVHEGRVVSASGIDRATVDRVIDLQMMDAADWSFAMDNAHPDIRAAARYLAPSHADAGVVTVLARLLARRPAVG